LAVSRAATEVALRRSRVEAELRDEKIIKENALRRSRAQADVAAEQALLRRRRLEE
jgi:hypothetical protein